MKNMINGECSPDLIMARLQDPTGKIDVGQWMQSTTLLAGDWCKEPCEIQAYRQLVCDAKCAGILVSKQLTTICTRRRVCWRRTQMLYFFAEHFNTVIFKGERG